MRTLMVSLAALVLASTANAAGGPSAGLMHGGEGVGIADRSPRYVTLPSGRSTVVAAIHADGTVANWHSLPGSFGVAAVAFDGTTDGLSADGSTLVLASNPSGRPVRTKFLVMDAEKLRGRRIFSLPGRWDFDAVSPNGRFIYLIQHLSATRPRYLVRVYDYKQGLLPKVVRDPREKERTMHGYPMARTASADGRWVYTLYSDPSVHSFVHALDTVGRAARCIDLPSTHGSDAYVSEIELADGGNEVVVRSDQGDVVGVIDTRSHEIKASAEDAAAAFEALRKALVFV